MAGHPSEAGSTRGFAPAGRGMRPHTVPARRTPATSAMADLVCRQMTNLPRAQGPLIMQWVLDLYGTRGGAPKWRVAGLHVAA